MEPSNKKSPSPRNYLSRREQFRLFTLFAGLGLVVLLMIEASKPENWYWMTGETAAVEESSETSDEDNYDTSYQPTPVAEPPADLVRIVPNFDPTEDESGRYFPGVNPGFLKEVKDNSPFIEEDWAWYNLLGVLAGNDSDLIRDASTGRVVFVQLFEQPDVYRGQLVTVRGSVRRQEWFPYGENPTNIPGAHRLVLRPKDGPARPLILYSLTLPDGFPTGDDLHEDIVATGFFYKNWNYSTERRSLLAPVVLAKDFQWQPQAATVSFRPTPAMMFGICGAVGVSAFLIAMGVYRRSRRLFADASFDHSREVSPESIAKLSDIEPAPTVGEQLRDLASDS